MSTPPLQSEALRHRIHEATPQQGEYRPRNRQSGCPDQEGDAEVEEEGPRRDS